MSRRVLSQLTSTVAKNNTSSVTKIPTILHVHKRNYGKIVNEGSNEYDVVIVGGGIVGTASAREMKIRHPYLKMAVVEKESALAKHQTGHNSGVIHAGIYYKPGSLKAKLCVEGMHLAYKYCDEKNIPYKKCGKLIVATNKVEVQRMADLVERGKKNNVPDMKVLKGQDEIQKVEPHCHGLEAIWSPHTGIVDWALVCKHYGDDFLKSGGEIHLGFEVNGFKSSGNTKYPVLITTKQGKSIKSKYVLTCGGLQSDKLAEMSGCPREPRIVPFRGEYLLLDKSKTSMVKGNIYPVPDPRFPFLGVHYTPRMNGDVWLGPNAVLAFKREGYGFNITLRRLTSESEGQGLVQSKHQYTARPTPYFQSYGEFYHIAVRVSVHLPHLAETRVGWTDISIPDLIDIFTYRGFLKMAFKFIGFGIQETFKSRITYLQVNELQKFIPSLQLKDVRKGPAGVRAQALDGDGNLVDDFYFDLNKGKGENSERVLHCRNAPSPGATSSLAIAKMMADKMEKEFKL